MDHGGTLMMVSARSEALVCGYALTQPSSCFCSHVSLFAPVLHHAKFFGVYILSPLNFDHLK